MFVYAFWEPRDSMPAYLQLCMETWKKNLPNAEIILLDYKNISDYLDIRELSEKNFPGRLNRSQVADAIRVALLAKYGGVWLDCDTVILSPDAEKYFLPDKDNKIVFFGYPRGRSCIIGYINSPPNTKCMNLWLQSIKEKLASLDDSTKLNWNFLGNSVLDVHAKEDTDGIKIIDDNLCRPEKRFVTAENPFRKAYEEYYFLWNLRLADVKKDMLCLHNSWTPPAYRKFSREDLLRCDCTMTNILAETLEIELPPPPKSVFVSRTWLRSKFLLSKIKIPRRVGGEIFLGVNDGEDAEIFQPNAFVVNGAD